MLSPIMLLPTGIMLGQSMGAIATTLIVIVMSPIRTGPMSIDPMGIGTIRAIIRSLGRMCPRTIRHGRRETRAPIFPDGLPERPLLPLPDGPHAVNPLTIGHGLRARNWPIRPYSPRAADLRTLRHAPHAVTCSGRGHAG